MKYPNLRHLNIALAVGRSHGFSNASASVNLSPSAVTQAMRRLEETLGAIIFDRTRLGAFPNELGRIYLDRVQRAFSALALAEQALEPGRERGLLATQGSVPQLRAVIAIVRCGSYSLAARDLGLSQPSIYKAARTLEALLCQQLFRPSSLGAEPTYQARKFARYASIALSEIERGQEEVLEFQGRKEGRLAIGSLPLMRTRMLPNAVIKLLDIYPDARVEVVDGVYSDVLDALRHGALDMIVGALRDPAPAKDITQSTLFRDELSVIVRKGHPMASKGAQPDLSALAELDWLVPRVGTPTRTYFDEMFQGLGYPSRIVETSSLMMIRAMLLGGDRAALLSANQAEFEIRRGDLAVVDLKLDGASRPIGVTTRSDWKPTQVQRKFLDLLQAEAQAL